MKCPHCGQDNPPQAKFCLECAAPLAAPSGARRMSGLVRGKALVVLVVGLVTIACGCARPDWIESTLVTVDVSGTWVGTVTYTAAYYNRGDLPAASWSGAAPETDVSSLLSPSGPGNGLGLYVRVSSA